MNRTKKILLCAAAIAMLFCTACSKNQSTEQKEAPQVEETVVAKAETQAPAPVETTATDDEVVFKIANGSEPASLDPALVSGDVEHRIIIGLFEGLVDIDPETGAPIPGLAESWDISEDGMVYTFHLRDAQWSDGKPITADDVVYSWIRELSPETAAPYSWFPAMFLEGAAEFMSSDNPDPSKVQVKALDDKTLEVHLVGPLPYVLSALTHYSFTITPKHCIEKWGESWTQPEHMVCNGPFVLEEHIPQTSITITKNPTYWDKDNVHLDKVIFYSSDDQNTSFNMYLNGEVDWETAVPSEQMSTIQMREDYHSAPFNASNYFSFNMVKGVTSNPYVRQALSLAIDREEMVEQVTKGGESPAYGVVPDMAGYEALEPQFDSFDEAVEEAQSLMRLAGYPNGIGFPKLTVIYNTNENNKQLCEFLQYQWKEHLGIDVVLENQEWQTFLANKDQGLYEIGRGGWMGDYQDPNTFLDMFVTGSATNGGQFSNETFDNLIFEAARTENGPERMEMLRTADYILCQEDVAVIPLNFPVSKNLIDLDKWGGWHTTNQNMHPLKGIYRK